MRTNRSVTDAIGQDILAQPLILFIIWTFLYVNYMCLVIWQYSGPSFISRLLQESTYLIKQLKNITNHYFHCNNPV